MHEDSYIRGGGPVRVDPRRLATRLAVAAVAVLGICSIALAVAASSDQSSAATLRRHGVAVAATVTSCTGITSGIGMGAEYYQCVGSYTLDGLTQQAVIHGSRAQLPRGAVVQALVIPGRPSTLSVPGAATSSSIGRYAPAIVLGGLAIAGGAGLAVRHARRRGPGAGPVSPEAVS